MTLEGLKKNRSILQAALDLMQKARFRAVDTTAEAISACEADIAELDTQIEFLTRG